MFSQIRQDLRYALRVLHQNPGFTAVAVISLALGIGVNTAIFSLIDAVVLRSLPIPNPETLVFLSDPASAGVSVGTNDGERNLFSYEEFERLRARNQVFTGMFAAESNPVRVNLSVAGGGQEDARACLVSEDYFTTLGVPSLIGRTFTIADANGPGSDPYIVISHAYWNKRFNLDPAVLGKSVQINNTFYTVIGVTPAGFGGEKVGERPDLWLPMMMQPQVKRGRDWLHDDRGKVERVMWLHVAGRLKPGVSQAQAQANVNVAFQQVLRETAGSNLTPDRIRSLSSQSIKLNAGGRGASVLRRQFSEPLLVLMTVVALVLLIACANVANLLLARATSRQREIGIRLAVGASRRRLIGQLMTESLLVAIMGGALGAFLAFWGSSLLLRMVSGGPNPIPLDVTPDGRILGFTAAVSLVTGLLFGLAPAFRATRVEVSGTLRENSRGVVGGGARVTAGKVLVIVQVAISLLLLVGAGLFLRTLYNLQKIDLGYPRDKMLLVRIDTLEAGYKDNRRAGVYRALLERFRAMPGVRGVTLSENGLFSGTESGDQITVEGYKPQKKGDDNARFDQVGPNYFSTIGIPILVGREIGPQDIETSPRVCVINETMAKFFFGKQNPIGKHITDEFPDTRFTYEIVGVSKDDRDHGLRGEIHRRFYVPFFQGLGGLPPSGYFEIRTFADPNAILSAVRHEVAQVDRALPLLSVRTLDDLLDRNLTQDRLIASLSAFFGLLALALASIGLYGVLSYAVARRTNEIGIRMALGAQRVSVLRMVFGETLVVVFIGLGIGLALSLAVTRVIESKLYGLKATDPVTFIAACAMLIVVAMLACYVPARRASRVDPLVALRYE